MKIPTLFRAILTGAFQTDADKNDEKALCAAVLDAIKNDEVELLDIEMKVKVIEIDEVLKEIFEITLQDRLNPN